MSNQRILQWTACAVERTFEPWPMTSALVLYAYILLIWRLYLAPSTPKWRQMPLFWGDLNVLSIFYLHRPLLALRIESIAPWWRLSQAGERYHFQVQVCYRSTQSFDPFGSEMQSVFQGKQLSSPSSSAFLSSGEEFCRFAQFRTQSIWTELPKGASTYHS